jgi:hypothetical protein
MNKVFEVGFICFFVWGTWTGWMILMPSLSWWRAGFLTFASALLVFWGGLPDLGVNREWFRKSQQKKISSKKET